jgi:hypothetical protein
MTQRIRDADLDTDQMTYQTTKGIIKTGILEACADDGAIHIYSRGDGIYYLKIGWHYQMMPDNDLNDEDLNEYEDVITQYYQDEEYLSCGQALSIVLESGPLYVDPIDIIEFYFDEQRSYRPTRPMENGLQQIHFSHTYIEGPICYITTRGDIKFGQLEAVVDPYSISFSSNGFCFLKIQFMDGKNIKMQEGVIYHNECMYILYEKEPRDVGIVEFFVLQ